MCFFKLCAASVRLVNSNPANTTAGRLEIKRNGVWGTVCDDRFSNAAATVICRQVGAEHTTLKLHSKSLHDVSTATMC